MAYSRLIPSVAGLLYGIKPVVIAIIAQALWGLGKSALKSLPLVLLGLGVVAANVAGAHELAVLAACGLVMALLRAGSRASRGAKAIALGVFGAGGARGATAGGLTASLGGWRHRRPIRRGIFRARPSVPDLPEDRLRALRQRLRPQADSIATPTRRRCMLVKGQSDERELASSRGMSREDPDAS